MRFDPAEAEERIAEMKAQWSAVNEDADKADDTDEDGDD